MTNQRDELVSVVDLPGGQAVTGLTLTELTEAVREELVMLWSDMTRARRDAHNGCWSVGCEHVAERIVALSRLVGATSWEHIDVAVLRDGTYERVYRAADIEYPPVDWARVEECYRRIIEGAMTR